MNKTYLSHYVPRWIIILIVISCIFSCNLNNSAQSKKDKINKTIQKALGWIYGHPANFAAGGFIEIAEEIITFYILSNHPDTPSMKQKYLREIEKRLDLINSMTDFKVKPQEYRMFLVLALISERLGFKDYDFKKIIEDKILSDPLVYPPHITTNIWNTLYLERLGYNPRNTMKKLLPQSTLSKEVQEKLLFKHTNSTANPMFIDPISITIFDITHEILAITDFGTLPPPPIIIDNKDFFSELFNRSIIWAIDVKHIDVLAELIMCAKIMNLEKVPSLESGIDFIISNQKKDGSFGETNPNMPNILRHGILYSIIALSIASR